MGKTKKRIIHILMVVLLIGLGAMGMVKLTESRPQIQKRKMAWLCLRRKRKAGDLRPHRCQP